MSELTIFHVSIGYTPQAAPTLKVEVTSAHLDYQGGFLTSLEINIEGLHNANKKTSATSCPPPPLEGWVLVHLLQ